MTENTPNSFPREPGCFSVYRQEMRFDNFSVSIKSIFAMLTLPRGSAHKTAITE